MTELFEPINNWVLLKQHRYEPGGGAYYFLESFYGGLVVGPETSEWVGQTVLYSQSAPSLCCDKSDALFLVKREDLLGTFRGPVGVK